MAERHSNTTVGRWAYAALKDAADRLTRRLRALGVEWEQVVGV